MKVILSKFNVNHFWAISFMLSIVGVLSSCVFLLNAVIHIMLKLNPSASWWGLGGSVVLTIASMVFINIHEKSGIPNQKITRMPKSPAYEKKDFFEERGGQFFRI